MVKESSLNFPNRLDELSPKEYMQVKINTKKFYHKYLLSFPTSRSKDHSIDYSVLELHSICKSDILSIYPLDKLLESFKLSESLISLDKPFLLIYFIGCFVNSIDSKDRDLPFF